MDYTLFNPTVNILQAEAVVKGLDNPYAWRYNQGWLIINKEGNRA